MLHKALSYIKDARKTLMNLTPGLDEDFDCFVVTVEASVMKASPSTFVTIVNLASLVEQEGDQDKLKEVQFNMILIICKNTGAY